MVLARVTQNNWRGQRPGGGGTSYLRRRPAGPSWAYPAWMLGDWRYGNAGQAPRCTLKLSALTAGRFNARERNSVG